MSERWQDPAAVVAPWIAVAVEFGGLTQLVDWNPIHRKGKKGCKIRHNEDNQ